MHKTLPGTTTAYTLLGPAHGSSYSPIFRRKGDPGGNLASLDAGDPGLYVGGGTINLSFANAIGASAAAFQQIHGDALTAAQAGTFVTQSFAVGQPVRFVSARLPDAAAPAAAFPAETAFLDLFAAGAEPAGEATNHALLYVVPPNGKVTTCYPTDADFLAAVTRTAFNAAQLLADYNTGLATFDPALGLAPIPVLRTCLLSGGQFRPQSVAVDAVAKAIFAGFTDAIAKAGSASGITLIEFENGGGEFAVIA
jgi:hypothetical protein